VLLGYQLVVMLVHPPWLSPVTDWLRAALAWPELAVLVFVSRWASYWRRPEARTWWILSVAMTFYAVARTLWSIDDQILFPNHAPFPSFPDPFFMLQYPFFFLAVVLIPSGSTWGSRVKLLLDGLLVMGSAAALSWYFLLAPLYLQSHVSPLGRFINLYYPTADLVVLFGLTVTLIYHQCRMNQWVMGLLIVAIICLVTADSWVAWLIATSRFIAGTPPDLFWIAFYVLVPLAGLVWLRLTEGQPVQQEGPSLRRNHIPIQRQDLLEVVRFLFPFVAALFTSAMIAVRAILAPVGSMSPFAPIWLIVGLGLLVIVRQGITLLENAQAQRERAQAQANEHAVVEANRQMEAFLGIASHELKTPLTAILMSLQLLQRRRARAVRAGATPAEQERGSGPQTPSLAPQAPGPARQEGQVLESEDALEMTVQQAGRLNRLINDLLDTSRIQTGQMKLSCRSMGLKELLIRMVEEQRQAAPERTIHLAVPEQSAPVWGDAERLGQVMTNYLTNALKYSGELYPVEVGLQLEPYQGQPQARVWVSDRGPGIPSAEQAHIWERFHRVAGIEVHSGSGIGLGLGLYISKTIVEQHGGQVGVTSMPGHGSTFWFRMPLLKTAPEAGG
jgi:signal transduction histidine kinase